MLSLFFPRPKRGHPRPSNRQRPRRLQRRVRPHRGRAAHGARGVQRRGSRGNAILRKGVRLGGGLGLGRAEGKPGEDRHICG